MMADIVRPLALAASLLGRFWPQLLLIGSQDCHYAGSWSTRQNLRHVRRLLRTGTVGSRTRDLEVNLGAQTVHAVWPTNLLLDRDFVETQVANCELLIG